MNTQKIKDKAREKIAELYWLEIRGCCSSWYWDLEWTQLKLGTDKIGRTHVKNCYKSADQTLSLSGEIGFALEV